MEVSISIWRRSRNLDINGGFAVSAVDSKCKIIHKNTHKSGYSIHTHNWTQIHQGKHKCLPIKQYAAKGLQSKIVPFP